MDFAAVRESAAKDKIPDKQGTTPRRSRPAKESKGDKPKKIRQRHLETKCPKVNGPPAKRPQPRLKLLPLLKLHLNSPLRLRTLPVSRNPSRQIVYIDLSELYAFKNHPFSVRDDTEMQGLVESVKASGVNQPPLVRPREEGGYEIVAVYRR